LLPSYVKSLVESKDPVDKIWEILLDIWKPVEDLKEYFRKESCESNFEFELNNVFFEIYRYLHDRISKASRRFQPPLIIVDGMSIREGNLLVRDLKSRGYKVLSYTYGFSALPSDTPSFRRIFHCSYIEVRSGEVPPIINPDVPVWISYPDEILHHAAGVVKPPEAYERTRNVVLRVLDRITESCILTITSDHGYIMVDTRWPMSPEAEKFLKSIFGGSRFLRLEEIEERMIKRLRKIPEEKSYVFMDNEYCYVKGRYFWHISGYRKVISHGGLSLMECIVPVITVEI